MISPKMRADDALMISLDEKVDKASVLMSEVPTNKSELLLTEVSTVGEAWMIILGVVADTALMISPGRWKGKA